MPERRRPGSRVLGRMNDIAGNRLKPILLIGISLFFVILAMAWIEKEAAPREWRADLNDNGIEERYFLHNHQITVSENQRTLWQSPPAWEVEQIVVGDATNDGREELLFLLRKEGSYGSSRPFWRTGADRIWSSHLFVYSLQGEKLRPVWCSSALDRPLYDLQIAADPADGQNYLTAREKQWGFKLGPRPRLRLKWDGWGFTCLSWSRAVAIA